ncbi:hypothetical protein J6590_027171 [Homalodisca vitripennis]|nr:hypothetical protein J6590_027171 [Homalodisca vitripennis]
MKVGARLLLTCSDGGQGQAVRSRCRPEVATELPIISTRVSIRSKISDYVETCTLPKLCGLPLEPDLISLDIFGPYQLITRRAGKWIIPNGSKKINNYPIGTQIACGNESNKIRYL